MQPFNGVVWKVGIIRENPVCSDIPGFVILFAGPRLHPVVVEDACGAGYEAATRRSLEGLKFAGDAFITDVATISALFRKSGIK